MFFLKLSLLPHSAFITVRGSVGGGGGEGKRRGRGEGRGRAFDTNLMRALKRRFRFYLAASTHSLRGRSSLCSLAFLVSPQPIPATRCLIPAEQLRMRRAQASGCLNTVTHMDGLGHLT